MHDYNLSYITKIDQEMSNISGATRIVYLESDYPDILELSMNKDEGSEKLQQWLNVPHKYKSFDEICALHLCRPLTAVYEEHSSYGILKDSKYYIEQLNIKENGEKPIHLKPTSSGGYPPVNYYDPKRNCLVGFIVKKVDTRPEDKAHIDGSIDLNEQMPVKKYIFCDHDQVLHFQIQQIDDFFQSGIQDDTCRFFYLTNANALDKATLSRMMQAFLESRHYPRAKLILTGTTRCIPDSLIGQVQLIRLGAPSYGDVRQQLVNKLKEECGEESSPFTSKQIDDFAWQLNGLTYPQLENVYAQIGEGDLKEKLQEGPQKLGDLIWLQKKMESEKDGTLAYRRINKDPGVVGVGGFSHWLNNRLPDLAKPKEARSLGITPPRGVILAGVPGTGKTQLAQQVAYQWSHFDKENPQPVSFIEFNIGNLSSKNYGESEEKLEKFLDRISEQAPAVLFVDEVEKTFYQDKKGNAEMHEVKKQQMGRLLGWLQEHEENIFTFMTSNNISILPPELIRSGRLSERFFVFLPNYTELMCMLYTFLRDKARNKIFHPYFRKEIENICAVIDEYSAEYGRGARNDADLDKKLSEAVCNSSLSNVLIELTEYAIYPKYDDGRSRALEGWCQLLKDKEVNGKVNMRTPFMTGADMKELVNSTLLRLRQKGSQSLENCDGRSFKKAMLDSCCNFDFMPYGQSNMEKLVKLYLSCDYRDVSAHPLLPKSQFDKNSARFIMDGEYILGTKPDNLYDQYLQTILVMEIEKAAHKEKAEQERKNFQNEQMDHQRKQWKKDEAREKQRNEHEENTWKLTQRQLERFK